MTNELDKALEAFAPNLEETYKKQVKRAYVTAIKLFKNNGFRGVYNHPYMSTFNYTIRPNCVNPARKNMSEKIRYVLSNKKLEVNAKIFAKMTIEAWRDKIEEKVGMLDEATVHHLDGYYFRISGKKNGHDVYINQDMIVNISSRGRLFNQWPARIYVDDKATSAAKYKKMFA